MVGRVVKALDSPCTYKGCIMRTFLMSCFSEPSYTAQPPHCRCSKCTTECLLLLSPTQGAILDFSVCGVQVVSLMAKAQTLYPSSVCNPVVMSAA